MLKKFDNITFKTNRKESKLTNEDFEKFLINFDKIEA
jgi:hypothetical protein